jgi:hypothetical protein
MQETIGRMAFLLGLVISVIAGFIQLGSMALGVLVILGIIVGFLNVTGKEVEKFLMGTIALILVGTVGLNLAAVIGAAAGVVNGIVQAFVSFVAGAALIVALKEVYAVTKNK